MILLLITVYVGFPNFITPFQWSWTVSCHDAVQTSACTYDHHRKSLGTMVEHRNTIFGSLMHADKRSLPYNFQPNSLSLTFNFNDCQTLWIALLSINHFVSLLHNSCISIMHMHVDKKFKAIELLTNRRCSWCYLPDQIVRISPSSCFKMF